MNLSIEHLDQKASKLEQDNLDIKARLTVEFDDLVYLKSTFNLKCSTPDEFFNEIYEQASELVKKQAIEKDAKLKRLMDKKPDENQNPTLIPNSAESINSDLSTNDNKKSVKNKRIQKPSKQNGDKTVSRSGSVNDKEKIKFTNPQDQSANQNQNKTRHEQLQQQQQPKPQRKKFQQPQQNASNQHQRQYTENNTKPQNFPQRGYSKKKG